MNISTTIFCIFFVTLTSSIGSNRGQQQPNSFGELSAQSVVFDLKNSSNEYSKFHSLVKKSSSKFEATNITSVTSYLLFQCHCQKDSVTIMYNEKLTYDTAVTGTSVGLVVYLKPNQKSASVWLVNNHDKDLDCVIAIVPHVENDPVPGGCNVEFNISTSPFLHLQFSAIQTVLEYQNANTGYKRSSKVQPSCSKAMYLMSYEFYVMFLPEGNFDITQYVLTLSQAFTSKSLQKNARNLKPYVTSPTKRLFFNGFPGQGVIYNIVAKYTSKVNRSDVVYRSAYVPYVTYGCSFQDEVSGCYSLNRTFTYVFCICAALVGLLICYTGHYFFKIEMFVAGFLAASLVTFILLLRYTSWSHLDRELLTLSIGAIGGVIWVLIWWFFGLPQLSIILCGFELGFLLSSLLFFTPLVNLDVFRSNFNFWMTFAVGIIFVPLIFIYFTKLLSMLFCAIMGSFGIVVAIDRSLRSTLSYIILNVVKRSIYGSMDTTNTVLPFQLADIMLCIAWILLTVTGFAAQYWFTKSRPDFPECPYKAWKRHRQDIQTTGQQSRNLFRRLRNFRSNDSEVDPLMNQPESRPTISNTYGSVD